MSSNILKSPWPYVALFLAHAIWGANFVVAKVTLQEFPIYSLAFLRFALAVLLLLPFFIIHSKKAVKIKLKDLPKFVAVGIFMVTLNIALFYIGIEKTTATQAATLTLLIPILAVLAGWWFLKEKVFFVNLLGIGLSLLGGLFIIGLPQIFLGNFQEQAFLGNVLIILSAISWVIGAIFSRELLRNYPSLTVTTVAFTVGIITFFVPALLEYLKNPGWPSQVSALGIMGLLYITLLSSISAYFLFEWGLAKTSVTIADLFQYIEPVVAVGVAILVLGELLTFSMVVGIVIIALGVYWGTFARTEGVHLHPKTHRV